MHLCIIINLKTNIMRTLGLLLGLFLMSVVVTAQTEETTYNITITIDNVVNDNGSVLAGLHNVETFMKGKGVQNLQSTIKDGKITLVFKDVKPGEYAILAMHDKNNNKQMDREANGMPTEDYGISGSSTPYGPPSFNDAKFTVTDKDLEFAIRF